MPKKQRYARIADVMKANVRNARTRIENKLGKMPGGCEDKQGNPTCPHYHLCKQVRTYDLGQLAEPLCVLSNEEVAQFEVEWREKYRIGAVHKVA